MVSPSQAANRRPNRPASIPPRRRRRKLSPTQRLISLLILAGVLVIAIRVGSAWLTTLANRSTYLSNIFVNGIDISPYSEEEGRQVVQNAIDTWLSTSYTLSGSGASWNFTAADFNGNIDIGSIMERAWNIGHVGSIFDCQKAVNSLKKNPIYFEAELEYDEDLIDAFVDTIYDAVYIAPTSATVVVDYDQPYLASESSRGQELDRETLKAQIVSLIETGEGSQDLPMVLLDPDLSTEEAVDSLELIVEYSTDVSFRGYNSRFNVRKGLSYFHGMEVHPGQEVNFNDVVGPRTQERGWQSATEYVNNTTSEGYGGGICQASSTLYGAMLKAGMTIIVRYPHSMTVSYVEPSIDAAVTESSKNLIFRNDTDSSIFIFTDVTTETATVRVYGKRPEYRYELESVIVSQDSSAVRVSYIDDTEGKYCYYENETKLYKKGLAACSSEGWLIAYDWDTGEEVSRTQLSFDMYESGTDIYWRGVHSLNEGDAFGTTAN